MKTKDIAKRVKVDATPPPPVGSVSVRISPNVTPDSDHVASFNAEQVEDIDENVELFAACNAPIPRIRRRYDNVYTQSENTFMYIC